MGYQFTKQFGVDAGYSHLFCKDSTINLQAGGNTLRLDFPERVTGPGELRKMLVRLAEEARAKP